VNEPFDEIVRSARRQGWEDELISQSRLNSLDAPPLRTDGRGTRYVSK
jgi:hypothetical protein